MSITFIPKCYMMLFKSKNKFKNNELCDPFCIIVIPPFIFLKCILNALLNTRIRKNQDADASYVALKKPDLHNQSDSKVTLDPFRICLFILTLKLLIIYKLLLFTALVKMM